MEEKRIYYKSDNLSVSFAPNTCIHAAECVRGLPSVFDISKKSWINTDAEVPEKIINVVNKCPSGALKYEVIKANNMENKSDIEELEMEKTKITVMTDGPLMIEGNLTVNKMSGENIKDGEKLFLCRCGVSQNKPFCDGAHKKAEFKAE